MSKEMKFTPGPWETGSLMTRVEVLPEGWRMPMCVADCNAKHSPKDQEECCANARLIAAAPELFAVCEQLQAWNEHSRTAGDLAEIIDAARAALAKAKEAV